MESRFKIFIFCLTSFVFIGCDRITKSLAKEHLMNEEPISYFNDTFRLEYVENTGAALSLGADLPQPYNFVLLSLLPLLLLLGVVAYTVRKHKDFNLPKLISLALVISGGLGNLIDRMFFDRHVPDFMNLGIQNVRTGIFNVADVCITFGVIGLLIFFRNGSKFKVQSSEELL
jgi:signal peptidase II